jgi:hypothetical protein
MRRAHHAFLVLLLIGCAGSRVTFTDASAPGDAPLARDATTQDAAGCRSDAECGDGIACTIDACTGGTCAHRPCTDCCASGMACMVGIGCAPPARACTRDADCDDGVRCTLDACTNHVCMSTPQDGLCATGEICRGGCIPARGACTTATDCTLGRPCDGLWSCEGELGCGFRGPLSCDDGDPCTADSCANPGGCAHSAAPDLHCGVGACARTLPACSMGAMQSCAPGTPTIETCNAIDDDCDGTTDEGIAMQTCGVGACARMAAGCASGATPTCTPGAPSSETCNGVDDDCNGTVDDGIAIQTCGAGACAMMVPGCVAGVVPTCVAHTASVETCNGIDDDCDGTTDEGIAMQMCGVGACAVTVPGCVGGVVPACVARAASSETCNGVDDDCDGVTDEGIAMQTCGVGACAATASGCSGGTIPACTPGTPGTEACNGIDDDCDGIVDEGLAMQTCGVGACMRSAPACGSCVPGTPMPEICGNGVDDDCNGVTDEAYTPASPVIHVAALPTASETPIVMAHNGEIAVAWLENAPSGTATVDFQRIDATNALVGGLLVVSRPTRTAWQLDATWSGTEYAVAWSEYLTWPRDAPDEGIYFQRISAASTLVGASIVVEGSGIGCNVPGDPSIASIGTDYGLAWDECTLTFQRISSSGALVGAHVPVLTGSAYAYPYYGAWPDLLATTSGYAMVWDHGNWTNLTAYQVDFANLTASGSLVAAPVTIDATTGDDGCSGCSIDVRPHVASFGAGFASVRPVRDAAATGLTGMTSAGVVTMAEHDVSSSSPLDAVTSTPTGLAVTWVPVGGAMLEAIDASGAVVGNPIRVAANAATPSLAFDGTYVVVAWLDPNDQDVYAERFARCR